MTQAHALSWPTLVIGMIVIHLVSGCAATSPRGAVTGIQPSAHDVRILSTEFKYEPSVIRVTTGQPVHLTLDNRLAETEHGIVFPPSGQRLDVKAGRSAAKTFVFDQAGEYDIVCDLPGHTEAGMTGKLYVVEP